MIEFRYIEKPDYADPLGHPPVTRYLQYRMWQIFVPPVYDHRLRCTSQVTHAPIHAYLENPITMEWTEWRDIPLIPEWDWQEDKPATPADGKEKGEDTGRDVHSHHRCHRCCIADSKVTKIFKDCHGVEWYGHSTSEDIYTHEEACLAAALTLLKKCRPYVEMGLECSDYTCYQARALLAQMPEAK